MPNLDGTGPTTGTGPMTGQMRGATGGQPIAGRGYPSASAMPELNEQNLTAQEAAEPRHPVITAFETLRAFGNQAQQQGAPWAQEYNMHVAQAIQTITQGMAGAQVAMGQAQPGASPSAPTPAQGPNQMPEPGMGGQEPAMPAAGNDAGTMGFNPFEPPPSGPEKKRKKQPTNETVVPFI